MKVLHISNLKNLSGWSKQAENHVLALDLAGVDIAVRHINILNNSNDNLHPRVKELLEKDMQNPDAVIQNVLPHMLEKTGRAKCISYFMCETDNFRASNWAGYLNMMDLVLCPCYENKVACINSGVTAKVEIVPICVDLSKYSREYPQHPLRQQHKEKFIFLCVAEWTTRKNIEAILRAFHLEFSPAEGVELVIKTTPVGMSNPQADITNRINAIKQGLKLYKNVEQYKRENIICGFLSETDMGSLYKAADCFVSASHGEAWCIPAIDAMGFGKTCIVPNYGGFKEYCTDKNSYLVSGMEDYCFGCNDSVQDLYCGGEKYFYPSVDSLRQQIRNAFEKRDLNLRKQQQAKKDIQRFTLENVGKVYREKLEKIL